MSLLFPRQLDRVLLLLLLLFVEKFADFENAVAKSVYVSKTVSLSMLL